MTSEFIAKLFINLFIILIIIQFIYFWHVKYGILGVINPLIVGIGQAIAILVNIVFFTAESPPGIQIMNFSSISIIIGIFYGGYAIGISLYMLTFTASILYTSSFEWFHFFSGMFVLFSAMVMRKQYFKLMTRQRLVASFVTALISSLAIMEIFTIIMINDIKTLNQILYVFLYITGTVWLVYSIERLEKNRNFKSKLIDTEKMQSVSHLAASISHEVRNPLTATKGFLQLLRSDENLTKEKKEQYIDIALSELDRADNIIKDFLAFAKPHINSKEDINIQAELNKVADIVQPLATMRNVRIQIEVASFIVRGEKQLFQQCFVNILKNGIESMGHGGSLTINTDHKRKGVDIHIIDTGIGMTNEQLKRLGEPYYSTKGVEGTGLGMMAVYRIIDSMKGSIRVKSKPGEGTAFTIYFPGQE
ncbi:HAMP domain-containing sensor histidine kinase [Bacillus sp. D386]|uniref:sensor histidine kinase n=1 Tax=Bacillus sp. D386 TaxID=2587155 RepID=UPI00112158CA|nr:HAMP domain-containing sensor histidine kinase [Bacillus sp. D386]